MTPRRRMRLGATLAHLSEGPPFDVAPWARRLVDAGFESLWTPQVIGRGSLVPDPFVALAAAAVATEGMATEGMATEGVELGTATVQVPLHHPADLAHRMLSLMAVCGDRLTLGVSPGSTGVDYTTLDRDASTRFPDFHRSVARLRVLLAEGRDEHASLAAAPDRVPELLLGSWGANVERAAREYDGWLASGYRRTPDEIVDALRRYRDAGGRRALVCAIPVTSREHLARTGDDLARYAEAGFDDAIVLLAPGGPAPDEVRALFPR